jgi:FtsZ-interacting cell division protein ZipA
MDEALEQAAFLDKLIKKYDALAILNIVARNDSFRLSDVDGAARDLGMVPNQRNVYVKHENDRPVYRMADKERARGDSTAQENETTRGITLFMDIPKTHDPARVFNDMVNDAKELCKRLDGKLVDDNHRGMTQKGLKRIAQEIRTMAAEMERDGIAPGRECALKLF